MVDHDTFPSVVTGRYATSRHWKCAELGFFLMASLWPNLIPSLSEPADKVARLIAPNNVHGAGPAECSPRLLGL
jgi:hypothetical protein